MSDFFTTYGPLIISMTIAAVLALSLYLPLMAGQLSLASPGFYAIGGYVAAVLSTQIFPVATDGQAFPVVYLLIEMVLAGVLCGILAILIGLPALRLRGIYLALATIAFVEIVRVLTLNFKMLDRSGQEVGGAIGFFNIPQPFDSKIEYLWVMLPLLLFAVWFIYRLERSRIGRAFAALREDELAASAMGVQPTYHKVLAFTMGAILAGMVGAVGAHFLNTWNARQGTFDASINILAFVIVGGSRTFLGPVAGGLLLTALPEVLRAIGDLDGLSPALSNFLKDGRLIIFGLLIVLATLFFPQGLIRPDWFQRRPPGKSKEGAALTPSTPSGGAT